MTDHERGMWNMTCWNGLDDEQQLRLIEHGNLPFGYIPRGECRNAATVEITTVWDTAPGPRFYCRDCAEEYLGVLRYREVVEEAVRSGRWNRWRDQ